MPLQVELVSPERILYSGEADMVIARTVGGGDIAFLPGHTPFVGALEIATVTLRTSGGDQLVAVHGGFVEVSNDTVTILSDVAELSDQIDVGRAERARDEAERRDDDEDGEASAALRRAHVRLAAAGAGPSGG
ncbi:MAG TPA: F0F1 ATP synthase subunit epsilon [Acidimicrobiales bacterium]|nr:F0F1 ATP synthase subunit epsilon [Acidimicrobiales bacterium]